MLNTLKKIPKKISIPLSIFAVIVFIITVILLNLEKIVEKVSTRFINGRVVVEDIDLSFSKPVMMIRIMSCLIRQKLLPISVLKI